MLNGRLGFRSGVTRERLLHALLTLFEKARGLVHAHVHGVGGDVWRLGKVPALWRFGLLFLRRNIGLVLED